MKRLTSTLLLAVLAVGAGAGCGSDPSAGASAGAGTAAALSSAARHLESRDGGDRDGDGDDDAHDEELRVSFFESVLNRLRQVPVLAPLFDRYGVPDPIVYDERARGLVSLLHAVRIRIGFNTLTITNRESGGVIYAAPINDLEGGTFQAENLPGASAPPGGATCAAFTYGPWGSCQADGTQTRAVLTSSPAGCTGGAPVTSQACSTPPPQAATCTAFTYGAWGACQADGTQARPVLTASPAGCTGGAPVTAQACIYVPPAQACGTCHAIPPGTGAHAFHAAMFACSACHGTGYSATAASAATHRNGAVDLAPAAGYTASSASCANACHGARAW